MCKSVIEPIGPHVGSTYFNDEFLKEMCKRILTSKTSRTNKTTKKVNNIIKETYGWKC
jgi:hypothetical protein